jgi:hypothetical protein
MTESDYQKILDCLESATRVLVGKQGELGEADIRIRHLLSISATETKRRLAELRQVAAAANAISPQPAA